MNKLDIRPPPTLQRIKKPLTTLHVRHKSQFIQKQQKLAKKLNSFKQLGLDITHRYNQKFLKLAKQLQMDENNSGQYSQRPKFSIKRKYLSFDYKQTNQQKIKNISLAQSSRKQQSDKSATQQQAKISILAYYKNMKQQLNTNRSQILNLQNYNKNKQTISGMYFIPNSSNQIYNNKYKCIYVKRNKKKISINPELRISKKQAQTKQDDIRGSFDSKRTRNSHFHSYFFSRFQNNINNQIRPIIKEKRIIRPWSGQSRQQKQTL